MQVFIENNQDKVAVTDEIMELLKRSVELALHTEGFDVPSEISIMLVDDEEIRSINREHRNIDRATDVLSFPLVEMSEGQILSDEGDFDPEGNMLVLGDIVISLETAIRQGEEYGHPFERELAFLSTHGVFHLLGYDHCDENQEKLMFGKQEAVLEAMGLRRNEE